MWIVFATRWRRSGRRTADRRVQAGSSAVVLAAVVLAGAELEAEALAEDSEAVLAAALAAEDAGISAASTQGSRMAPSGGMAIRRSSMRSHSRSSARRKIKSNPATDRINSPSRL